MDTNHSLLSSASPVTLISACGLIMLALYNRLGAIHARIRTFHQQKIELLSRPTEDDNEPTQMLLDRIDFQIIKVTVKATAIQKGLFCQLGAVLVFLLCSTLVTVLAFSQQSALVAIGLQAIGLLLFAVCCLLFAVGICWAIQELSLSLTPLEEASAYLDILTSQRKLLSKSDQRIRVAKAA
jgi:hypothetical protein